MNLPLLRHVVEELSQIVIDARVERVFQGMNKGVYLALYGDKRRLCLLIAPDRRMPRLHLVSAKPETDTSPSGFVLLLKRHLVGLRVAGVRLLNGDRVVEFVFGKDEAQYRLIVELIGPAANLFFLDPAHTILSAYHPVPFSEGAKRALHPGLPYAPPSPRPARPEGAPSRPPDEKRHSPEGPPIGQAGGGLTANRAAEDFFVRRDAELRTAALKGALSSVAKKCMVKTGRRIAALAGDLDAAGKAEEFRRAGTLILANLPMIERGVERVELIDGEGKPVEIFLEAARSAVQNAERYFKKYKKAKTGRDILSARKRHAEEEASFLNALAAELSCAETEEALVRLRRALVSRGYLIDRERNKKGASPDPQAPLFRKTTYLGWEIYVGKSAAGNDYLTMKLADPDDLWLHAEGLPGSHVLVKNSRRVDVPSEVLTKAASLAAFYSKGRGSTKVPVTYTFARFVKKPKGAKPGLVLLAERKTIMARPIGG